MAFDVAADAYDRFMGRYSAPLAGRFTRAAGVAPGQTALDVGCGPGSLSAQLVDLLGAGSVTAIDPSTTFVAALRERLPGVDARVGQAESLPYAAGTFDVTLAQLVVPFMADPVAGLREMARVTKPGGTVAACVWDHAGRRTPLTTYWAAMHDLDATSGSEANLPGAREGQLAELFDEAEIGQVTSSELTITVRVATFEDWWTPMTQGVGPVGDHYATLSDTDRVRLRARCAELLPHAPIDVVATAWCVVRSAANAVTG